MSPPSLATASGAALPAAGERNRGFSSLPLWCAVALAAWLVLRVFVTRIGHDESQYVAGADLALHYSIFRDYLSLQPPLQSWVYAPLALLFTDDVFLAMRLMTAFLGFATVVTVYLTLRSIDAGRRNALLAAGCMAAVGAFQNASAVVRNDILPSLLLSIAVWAALIAVRKVQVRFWVVAGIALGLAASTKLSYVPLCLAAGAFVALHRNAPRWSILAYASGLGIGALPALLAWDNAPSSFLWGVLTYGETAPFQWYRAIGQAGELSPFDTIEDTLGYLLLGPALLALTVVGTCLRASLATDGAREMAFLALMILAGLIAAVLPTPSHSQYVVPLLPPLFVAFGLALPKEPVRAGNLMKLLAAFAAVGMVPSVALAYRAVHSGSPILADESDAAWIRKHLPPVRPGDEITSFSPERAVDSGLPIDDDFATGPFVFRTGYLLSPRMAAALHVAVPSNLEQLLDKRLPVALLTGYESPPDYPGCLDDYLEAFARRHGYRLLRLPDGAGRLYVRPNSMPVVRSAAPAIDLRSGCKGVGLSKGQSAAAS
jgi:hypothetical protein